MNYKFHTNMDLNCLLYKNTLRREMYGYTIPQKKIARFLKSMVKKKL